MKKVLFIICSIVMAMFACVSCKNEANVGLKEVAPYIYETKTYTKLDYDNAREYFKKNYDKWGGGCSAVAKVLKDGTTIVGRNMDLNISNKCAYIVRTNCPNKYKTVGLAYTFRDISPDYEVIKNGGMTEEFDKILPFMCDDVINEQGLYIEINMRNAEVWPGGQDKFACSGTNKFSKERVYMFEIPRYIGENCATVEEAVKYAKTLNVYSEEKYWNYCFMIADRFGNYGLLEFCMNSVYWLPNQVGQTNFYINEDAAAIQDQKTGKGRLDTLLAGIDKVKSKDDMFKLMDSVSYFQFYDPYHCKFDPRSENIGTFAGATYDFVMNEKYKKEVLALMDAYGEPIRNMSREELRAANKYWESAFTEVADCNEKSIMVRFYQDNSLKYKVTIDKTEKIE